MSRTPHTNPAFTVEATAHFDTMLRESAELPLLVPVLRQPQIRRPETLPDWTLNSFRNLWRANGLSVSREPREELRVEMTDDDRYAVLRGQFVPTQNGEKQRRKLGHETYLLTLTDERDVAQQQALGRFSVAASTLAAARYHKKVEDDDVTYAFNEGQPFVDWRSLTHIGYEDYVSDFVAKVSDSFDALRSPE